MTSLELHQQRCDEVCDSQDKWRMRDHYEGVAWGIEAPQAKNKEGASFDSESWNRFLQTRYNERNKL